MTAAYKSVQYVLFMVILSNVRFLVIFISIIEVDKNKNLSLVYRFLIAFGLPLFYLLFLGVSARGVKI